GAPGDRHAGPALAGDAEPLGYDRPGLIAGEPEEPSQSQPPTVQPAVVRETVTAQRVAAELVLGDTGHRHTGDRMRGVHERTAAPRHDVPDGAVADLHRIVLIIVDVAADH